MFSLLSLLCMQFAVNDITFYDVICIPRGQADGALFTRPFLPFCVGGAGARDLFETGFKPLLRHGLQTGLESDL